ncbi:MAG: hypothetical protein D6800_02945, partial [Candidatus Zixiibacteriota bacterium]
MRFVDILRGTVLTAMLFVSVGMASPQVPPAEIPGQAIVRFSPGAMPDSILLNVNANVVDSLHGSRTFLIAFPPHVPVQNIINALSQFPEVAFAAANLAVGLPEVLQISQGFTDQQAESFNAGSSPTRYYNQASDYGLGFDSAQLFTDGAGTIVAVIDNGIATQHPLFDQCLLPNGYDFVDNDTDPSEVTGEAYGHGTFVSGLIHLGAPASKLLPLRAFGPDGFGNLFAITKAIYYAIDSGAAIINMSFGVSIPNTALETAIADAHAAGVTIVAAAGNNGDTSLMYPAAYPGVIAVSALDTAEQLAAFSNHGAYIDLCAPGENLYSSMAGDYLWGTWSGTSFAAPLVTAACALLHAESPTLSPDAVATELFATARRELLSGTVSPPDPRFGMGAVDAFSALVDLHRGDVNLSNDVDVADLTSLVDLLFISFTPPPVTVRTADIDCNGTADVADLTKMVDHLFIDFNPFT